MAAPFVLFVPPLVGTLATDSIWMDLKLQIGCEMQCSRTTFNSETLYYTGSDVTDYIRLPSRKTFLKFVRFEELYVGTQILKILISGLLDQY